MSYRSNPSTIRTELPVKIAGHSLKGMKLILKPVKRETIERRLRATTEIEYTTTETAEVRSMTVAARTTEPMDIRAIPSVIHSMVMMRLLSSEIEPNPFTTDPVGKRWAIPHTMGSKDPIQRKTAFAMHASYLRPFI
jgi:hypothetical protein